LHATNLGQLLEDLPFFFVRKALLECSLFVADTLGSRGETWGGQVQQDVGTIHPVDMRHHGIEAMSGDLKTSKSRPTSQQRSGFSKRFQTSR
jgi:hypothetical protein